jgi:hypothetical protein
MLCTISGVKAIVLTCHGRGLKHASASGSRLVARGQNSHGLPLLWEEDAVRRRVNTSGEFERILPSFLFGGPEEWFRVQLLREYHGQ